MKRASALFHEEFLGLLGRHRLVDVRFGDHAVRGMHVFLSDMRQYTTLVEGKTTADAFAFVNEYLQHMEVPIREHNGFICNVEGDAILALFPDSSTDAVRAGIASHRALEQYNVQRQARGGPEVEMGVGISSGPLLLGTVGCEERLRCDVVGDAVNLASRVESLTKTYGTRMLVNGHTAEGLSGEIKMRQVDRVRVKGRARPVDLYEVLDALPDEPRDRRLATQHTFEQGVIHMRAGDVNASLAAFHAVLAQDPDDPAAQVLAARCIKYQDKGLPANWTGATRLAHK